MNRPALFTQVELLEQALIPVGVRLAQVIEQAPAHRHHLKEAAARGMIFGVTLEVVGQLRDPAGEERDLYIRAARILFVQLKLPHVHRVTAFCHNEGATLDEERALARSRWQDSRLAERAL